VKIIKTDIKIENYKNLTIELLHVVDVKIIQDDEYKFSIFCKKVLTITKVGYSNKDTKSKMRNVFSSLASFLPLYFLSN
jgi:hypothetical protein